MQYILTIGMLILLCTCQNGTSNTNTSSLTEEETLAGVDADQDGVRDDVQEFIETKYAHSEKMRRTLKDYARGHQAFIVNHQNKEEVLKALEKRHKGMDCTYYIVSDVDKASKILGEIKVEFLNTEERIKAYYHADSHLGGMVFSLPKDEKAQCSFDPDSLAN